MIDILCGQSSCKTVTKSTSRLVPTSIFCQLLYSIVVAENHRGNDDEEFRV